MASIKIGAEAMRECERCGGLWVEVGAFEKICADREQQSAVLGGASLVPKHQIAVDRGSSPTTREGSIDRGSEPPKVRYVPCPQCGQLMNRINFARCSGVVVDVCRGHGTWFDRDELRGIVEFIRSGGLDAARQKEKREIEFEREQLRAEQLAAVTRANSLSHYYSDEDRTGGLSAARGLLKFLIE